MADKPYRVTYYTPRLQNGERIHYSEVVWADNARAALAIAESPKDGVFPIAADEIFLSKSGQPSEGGRALVLPSE